MLAVVWLVAIAVKLPATVFAVIFGETATPFLPVVTVAVSVPLVKLAPAPDPPELAPLKEPPAVPSVNVTVAPITGRPFAFEIRTRSLPRYGRPTVAVRRSLPIRVSRGPRAGSLNN
jgi:hypothetical protein